MKNETEKRKKETFFGPVVGGVGATQSFRGTNNTHRHREKTKKKK